MESGEQAETQRCLKLSQLFSAVTRMPTLCASNAMVVAGDPVLNKTENQAPGSHGAHSLTGEAADTWAIERHDILG